MKKQIKVLINDFGKNAKSLIDMLHNENIYVIYITSNRNENIKNADEFFIYENFCYNNMEDCSKDLIDFCVKNEISTFIPFKKTKEFNKYKTIFKDSNILLAPPQLFNNNYKNDNNKFINFIKNKSA